MNHIETIQRAWKPLIDKINAAPPADWHVDLSTSCVGHFTRIVYGESDELFAMYRGLQYILQASISCAHFGRSDAMPDLRADCDYFSEMFIQSLDIDMGADNRINFIEVGINFYTVKQPLPSTLAKDEQSRPLYKRAPVTIPYPSLGFIAGYVQ